MERTLLDRVKDRQEGAWEELVAKYASRLERRVRYWNRKFMARWSSVEDVTQEAWMGLFLAIDTVTAEECIWPMLRLIAYRKVVDHSKSCLARLCVGIGCMDQPDPVDEIKETARESMPEVLYVVQAKIKKLRSPTDREMVWDALTSGDPPRKIAERWGVSERSVTWKKYGLLSVVRKELCCE